MATKNSTTIIFSDDQKKILDNIAKEEDRTVASVIRRAINYYLKEVYPTLNEKKE